MAISLMAGLVLLKGDSMFQHSIRSLRESFQFFRDNPDGVLAIHHRGGFPEEFTRDKFANWFRRSLDHKINVLGGINDAPESLDVRRFHRTYTGTRIFLRSQELHRVAREFPKRQRAKFLAAFNSRAHEADEI